MKTQCLVVVLLVFSCCAASGQDVESSAAITTVAPGTQEKAAEENVASTGSVRFAESAAVTTVAPGTQENAAEENVASTSSVHFDESKAERHARHVERLRKFGRGLGVVARRTAFLTAAGCSGYANGYAASAARTPAYPEPDRRLHNYNVNGQNVTVQQLY